MYLVEAGTNVLTPEQAAGIENNDWVEKALKDQNWTVIQMGDNNSTGLNGSLLDQVSPLFIATNFNNYAEFAITAHGGSEPNSWLSLEMIHNYIHNLVGGVGWPLDPSQATGSGEAQCSHGHMVDLGTAAFDPISGCITATLIVSLLSISTIADKDNGSQALQRTPI